MITEFIEMVLRFYDYLIGKRSVNPHEFIKDGIIKDNVLEYHYHANLTFTGYSEFKLDKRDMVAIKNFISLLDKAKRQDRSRYLDRGKYNMFIDDIRSLLNEMIEDDDVTQYLCIKVDENTLVIEPFNNKRMIMHSYIYARRFNIFDIRTTYIKDVITDIGKYGYTRDVVA